MAAPDFDGPPTTVGAFSSTNSGSASHTFGANALALICIGFEGNTAQTVSNVTSPNLSFGFKHRFTSGGTHNVTHEIWAAQNGGSVLTSEAVSVVLTGTIDDAVFGVWGITGAWAAAPFDGNVSNFSDALETGTDVYSGLISTTEANDLIIAMSTTWRPNVNAGVPPSGWTNYSENTNSGGSNWCSMQWDYQRVSTLQSNLVYTLTASGFPDAGNEGITTMIAITADSGPSAGIFKRFGNRIKIGSTPLPVQH